MLKERNVCLCAMQTAEFAVAFVNTLCTNAMSNKVSCITLKKEH